jgi:peptidoglycan-associated lipoprotein
MPVRQRLLRLNRLRSDVGPKSSKESEMTKQGSKALALLLMTALLFAISGCQKKEIASEAGYGATGGAGAAGGKGIGEQDLGGAAGRPGAGGASIGAVERAAFENEDIYFAYDSSAIAPQAQDILRKKATFLKSNPNVKVTIEGHCDERGTNEYNLALGEARARTAKAFLVDLGIPAARLATISYGEERPMAKGHTEEDYAKNRRAHFVIEQ